MKRMLTYLALVLACGLTPMIDCVSSSAHAQVYDGPMLPHVGLQVTTSFDNAFGPDAESHSNSRQSPATR